MGKWYERHAVWIVLVVSLVIWGALWAAFQVVPTNKAPIGFKSFMDEWGAAIGILYTIVLGVFVALIPNRLERRVQEVSERIESPLQSFHEIFHSAVELLEELGRDKKTTFRMIAAAPVLGFELSEDERDRWSAALAGRVEGGCPTEIICLSADLTGKSPKSSLGRFCDALAVHYKRDASLSGKLFRTAQDDLSHFQALAKVKPNFKLRTGEDPPLQIILAKDSRGRSKGIIYFANTATITKGVMVSGFRSEDSRTTAVMDQLFEFVRASAVDAIEDPRDSDQRDRDAELMTYRNGKAPIYKAPFPEIHPGLEIEITERVFPADKALARGLFVEAIKDAAGVVWRDIPTPRRLGIDMGTGAGTLAIQLSKFCERVWAIDIDTVAIECARKNTHVYKTMTNSGCNFDYIVSDLFRGVQAPPADSVPLIVFNHPYYPTLASNNPQMGMRYGTALVRDFLNQARPFLGRGGGIVMSSARLAKEHGPVEIAGPLGYSTAFLRQEHHPKYGSVSVWLFTPGSPERLLTA